MANEEHLKILKQGVEVWNRWREENRNIRPNLRLAMLSQADLSKIDLSRGDLSGADLGGTNLRNSSLIRTNLSRASLSRANLVKADLRNAVLIEANLYDTDFSRAKLNGTDFSQAFVSYTKFGAVDLGEAKGLDLIQHFGPSIIGIDTLYLSSGKISEIFLRGAGVPDVVIEYLSSLTNQPVQYYSCFISYSSKDEAFAHRLHTDLQQQGVRCWFAPEDMKIGDKIRPAIDQSIRVHDKLLIILSKRSINSTWVEKEVETAFEEEAKRKQTVLFPVRLDAAVMETDQAWAADIRRTRHIGDFSRWKDHDAYQQAFERLLRDLKAEH